MTRPPPVSIGITGHRVLAEEHRLTPAIDEAFTRLAAAFPNRPLCLISALAEGADRLVTRAGLRRGATLVAILPLHRSEYERDFGSPASHDEFAALIAHAVEIVEPDVNLAREVAYARAGRAVVDRSDAMIAVWDGLPAQGSGGTADIVAAARTRAIPLVWIHAGNRTPGTAAATSLGAFQGVVTCERL